MIKPERKEFRPNTAIIVDKNKSISLEKIMIGCGGSRKKSVCGGDRKSIKTQELGIFKYLEVGVIRINETQAQEQNPEEEKFNQFIIVHFQENRVSQNKQEQEHQDQQEPQKEDQDEQEQQQEDQNPQQEQYKPQKAKQQKQEHEQKCQQKQQQNIKQEYQNNSKNNNAYKDIEQVKEDGKKEKQVNQLQKHKRKQITIDNQWKQELYLLTQKFKIRNIHQRIMDKI